MKDKRVYGFFDVDGTLVQFKTMLRFMWFYQIYLTRSYSWLGQLRYGLFRLHLKFLEKIGKNRSYLNYCYYRYFKRHRLKTVEHVATVWFRWELRNRNTVFHHHVVKELQRLQQQKVKVVLVSGSFTSCLKGVAKYLGVDTILASRLETEEGGILTGKLLPPQTIGAGKVRAIHDFLCQESESVDLSDSFAYGDHISDLPMLELVGHPIVVRGDHQLEQQALSRQWAMI
ncbi:MAG: HAD-IB family hydrolase [Pseudomonadota bacterium]